MRVEKINTTVNTYATRTFNKNECTKPVNSVSADYVTFTGKKDDKETKPSIFGRIAKIFTKEKTPEYEKSEDIKYFMGDVEALIKEIEPQGKMNNRTLNNILYIGKVNDYKGYIPLVGKSNEKLVFGPLDEETGLPTSATMVDMDKGLKPVTSFELIDRNQVYIVHDGTVEDKDIKMTLLGEKIIEYTEKDKETGSTIQLVPTKDGFKYFEGTLDAKGEPVDTNIDVDFYYKDIDSQSTYKEKNEKGELDTYKYNKETDMWEKQNR